jgi:hypothetical protein
MRTAIKIAAVAAITIGAADLALGQGPIREGLRRTGEAAANVTRGVAEGTANVARGVGDAAVGTVQATADALTPATPYQARGGAGLDNSRDARWRFARHNNEWWYYTPQNEWMYHRDGNWQEFSQDSYQPMNQGQQLAQGQQFNQGQQYSAGYRGMEQGQFNQGMNQQVRHDHQGRAYICENGQAVYLDQGQQHLQGQALQDHGQISPTPAQPPQQYEAGRQSFDQQGAPPQPAQPQGDAQQGQPLQSEQSRLQSDQPSAAPANPAPAGVQSSGGEAEVSTAPAGSNTGSQAQGDPAAPREINNNPTSQTQGATENPGQ